jgi:hypothetical protein
MMHLLFESMPFVVGGAYGMVVPRSGCRGLWANLVIGAFCAWFAGELVQGATEAVVCLAADSAAALFGCLFIGFARRLVARSQS